MVYPMKTRPVFKDYIWGGDKLATRYNKQTDIYPIAESWEISAYPEASCIIDNGEFAGETLLDVVTANPGLIAGKSEFPVLVKLLDAKDNLSFQVHPDDGYARKNEGSLGKNELWFVLDCEEGAEIVLGLKSPLSREELEAAIADGSLPDKVNRVPVRAGDCFQIPAGLLHAIGEGVLIAEVQQSSDVTYRVYDYGRTGADGKPRELHIEKALDVIDTSLKTQNARDSHIEAHGGFLNTKLTDWEYFTTNMLRVTGRAELRQDDGGFSCATLLDGALTLVSGGINLNLIAGDSVFIPAGLGDYTLEGVATVLLTES